MAYKKQSDPELIEDIHSRKEFAQLWVPTKLERPKSPSTPVEKESSESHSDFAPKSRKHYDDFRGLMTSVDLQTNQQFVRNFMNPNTPNMRMHLMHSTGSGKTRAMIATAQECIRIFRYVYRGINWRDTAVLSPSIFVIAFAGKSAFFNDLIKYPEFGYVSVSEYEYLMQLYQESVENDEAYKKYSDLWSSFKRRATSRSKGGFYKFYGYDEFANRLFGSDVTKINVIIQEAHKRHEPCSVTLERAIAAGDIKPDATLLARLENSMLIADEIHNTYNTQSINNRGIALQYVLDHVKGLRFLSASATPINGVPAEIADFINYFVDPQDKVMRESLFAGNALLPGAIDKINELLRGHISFLYDFDPRYFPTRIDNGIPLTVVDRIVPNGRFILPYLRFIPCVMSDLFVNTIREFYRERNENLGLRDSVLESQSNPKIQTANLVPSIQSSAIGIETDADIDDEVIGIPQHAYALFDMIFPNPHESADSSASSGLYSSSTLFGTIHSAPQTWKNKVGVATRIEGGLQLFSGPFLHVDQLSRYSAKYARMISLILEIIQKGGPCKIMVYHERVRLTGILIIREILRENGIINETEDPVSNTRCAICTLTKADHTKGAKSHEFRPLRMAALYSELDKSVINSIRERYNSVSNLHGEWCSILIGSKLIRESYDFSSIQHLIVLSLPISISQLIQVFGRCVRRASHLKLPPEERFVNTYMLVNIARISEDGCIDNLIDSPEIRRYFLKLQSYLTVQKIERELARNAIDAGINRNIITRPKEDSLGFLLYDEPVKFQMPANVGDLNTNTFFAYGYGSQEIQFTIDIIKKLFRYQSVWRANDLIRAVHAPPFGVWSNPALIAESSIIIALSFLISAAGNLVGMHDRAIIIGGIPHLIVAAGGGGPIALRNSKQENIHLGTKDQSMNHPPQGANTSAVLTDNDYLFLAPVETVEVAGVAKSRALIDVESFIRGSGSTHDIEDIIPINQFELQTSFEESILSIMRSDFKPAGASSTTKRGRAPIGTLLQMRPFLIRFSTDQQRIVVQHFIERPALREEFHVLYQFLTALGVFVPFKYANKYRDISRRFDIKFAKLAQPDDPVAFGDGSSVRLYTGMEWISMGRSALNMHIEFNENNVLVGIYKQFPYKIKFQLREPIQKLRAQHSSSGKHKDARTIERGSVCITNLRRDIEKNAQLLGLRAQVIHEARTAHDLCDIIQVELLRQEIKERADSHSLVKFVYGWWNAIPTPF